MHRWQTATPGMNSHNRLFVLFRSADVDPTRYSVLRLLRWKQEAEQAVLEEIEGKKPREPEDPPQKEGWICPFCKTIVEFDQTVCLGCHAEVVYGAARAE